MKFSLRVIALTVCICMMSALFPIYALAASEPSEWARAEVDLATSAGLVPRRITDDYKADITREEFCEIVVNLYFALSQKQAPAVKTKFTDTDNRSVAIAYGLGIVNGVSENEFAPTKKINRQEICTMLARCIDVAVEGADITKYPTVGELIDQFVDADTVSNWAEASVFYAIDKGIMNGMGKNGKIYISPFEHTTREQAIVLVYRVLNSKDKLVHVAEIPESFIDADFDGLSDEDERQIYGTDPENADTDGDGVNDGWEVKIGTDPKSKQTVFEHTVSTGEVSEDQPVVASVSLELDDKQVGTLEVNPVSSAEEQLLSPSIPGYMGAAYDFSVDGEFDSAEITFAYDKSVGEISDTFQPRVYYFNEKTGMLEKLPNQKVENGKITVEVSHFSKYLVLNSVEFDLVWATEIRRPTDSEDKSVRRDMDVVFVIDESNSMENMKDGSNNDSKRIRVDATKKFIDNLEENDRVAIVGFADVGSERTLLSLSYDKADGKRQADNILGNVDGTAVHAGLKHALKELNANGRPESDKVIIAITDGVDSTEVEYSVYEEFIEAAKKSNVTLYTVGVGSDVDKVLLTNIAESLGGKYFHASTADDIYEGFEIVEEETIDFTKDSNEDGISDYYSRLIFDGVLRLSNGAQSFAFVDFGVALDLNDDGEISSDELANPDIDGDGILNGDELVVVELDGKVFLRMLSNPLVLDSDGDGYKDYEDPHLMFSDYLSKNVSDFRYITDNTEFEYSSFCNTYTKDFWAQAGDSFVRGITFTNMQKEYTQQLVGFLGDSLNIDVIQDSGIDSFDDICTEILNHEILQYTEAGFDLIGLVGEGGELLSTKEIAEITDAVTGLKTFSSTKMLGLNPDVLQELFALGELKKNAMFKLDEARELGKSAKSISGYQSWVTRYSNQIDDLIPNLTKKFDVDIADSFNSTKKLTLTRKTPSKVFDALDKVGKIADVASVGITLFDGLCTTEQIIDMTSGLASYNGEIDLLNTYGELFHYLANHATSNFTKSAARFVLNSMGEGFAEVLCQISQNLLLTGADVAFQLISIVGLIPQPFGLILGVAKFVFDVCDMIFGFTEKAVTRGKMVCIYDLSNALSTMVNRYYLLDDALKKHESTEYSFVKYVRMLMESRIIGENHYLALNKGDSEALANIAEVEALAKKMNLTLVIH